MSVGLVLCAVPLALLAFGLSVWLGAGRASAHATLERTAPAANAHLRTEPRQVSLYFDEPVDVALGHVTVIGPVGDQVSTGYASRGKTVVIGLRPDAGNGTYVVSYRVVSQDTHPVSGGFYFQVGHGSPPAATTGGAGATPVAPPESGSATESTTVRAVYAACRYAGFVGLMLLIGGAVFVAALWPVGLPDRRTMHLVWLGYGLAVAGSMGELVLQAPYATGSALTAITGVDFDQVVDTRFGTAHLVRLGLLAVSAPVLAGLAGRPSDAPDARRARWAQVAGVPIAVALLVTWAYSGHAGTTTPAVSVPSDVVHLGAMAVWIGGLVVLATTVLPATGSDGLRAVLPRWSRLAMFCVAALIASGTVQALIEIEGWSGLIDTTYGQLVLTKIGLLVVVLVVANVSRRWVQRHYLLPVPTSIAEPGSRPSRAEVGRLRRGVAIESVVAAAAIAVAAVLVEAAPGGTAVAASAPRVSGSGHPITRHGAPRLTVRKKGVIIRVKVDPGVVGVQYIYLSANRPHGGRLPVRQWTLTVSNQRLGLDHVNVPVLIDSGVGHHFVYGSFTMPTGGRWTISVTARTSDIDETIVTRTVRIRS